MRILLFFVLGFMVGYIVAAFAKILGIAELKEELWEYKRKYFQLINSVTHKIPKQSRHETALRYIERADEGLTPKLKFSPFNYQGE